MNTKTPKSQHAHFFIELLEWLKIIGTGAIVALIIVFIIWLIPQPYYKDGFCNLEELQEYAITIDEFIKMEGENYNNPNYESYYQEHFGPSITRPLKEKLNWILYTLHLKRQPLFSESFFKTILANVTQYRRAKGWRDDFIQKIETSSQSKIVVFGPVQGAFHGLVRDLSQLKALNIINENLTITNPNYYIVFLGNVVGRSPYTLEIFSILLRLLQRNPENLIYLRGSHECSDIWKLNTLRRELELRANSFSYKPIPLEEEVDSFFNTLPWTLYCTIPYLPNTQLHYFKCAPLIEDQHILTMIDAPTYASFLMQKSNERLIAFNLNNRSPSDPSANSITSLALIRGVKKRELLEKIDGLKLLSPTKGVITWTVLSSTSEGIRITENLFNDSFTIIQAAQDVTQWTINLYQHDIRNKDNKNFNKTSYNFFLGNPINH